MRTIAKRLNAAGRPRPRAQQGRPAGWVSSSVWAVLRRPLYRGEIVWNQTRKRNQWGAKASTARQEQDWIRVPAPALRIVPEELCQAVQDRAAGTKAAYLKATGGAAWGRPANAQESKYLLTGFTRCAHCGGSLVVRGRSHGSGRSFWYACSAFHHRGRSVCENSLEVRIERADDTILGDLQQFVLHSKVVGRAIELALEELQPSSGRAERERARLEKSLRHVQGELGNLTRALAAGGDLPSLLDALKQAEQQRQTIETAIAAFTRAEPFTARSAKDLKSQVLAKVDDWRATLRRDAPEARQVLRQLVTNRINLEATEREGERLYRHSRHVLDRRIVRRDDLSTSVGVPSGLRTYIVKVGARFAA